MALTQLAPPYPIFTDKSGSPLDAGYLYFGEVNKNPETNPIQVYYDSAFTQPAAQPLRTSNGYVMRNGSPALIYADSQFSVTVRDKNNALVIYSPVGYGVDPASVSGTVIYDDFTGDGVTTIFVLTASPSTKNATNVYIDGVYQSKDNYNTVGSTLTFSTAPPLNSAIEVVSQESSIIGGASSQQITYNQGGAGAVTRTVQSRLRDFVSVKDFGAVGDGVTDDTAAIQAAVNATTNKVYTPSGTYKVTSTITLPEGVWIEGDGEDASLFVASGMNYPDAIFYSTADNAKVLNIGFRGSRSGTDAGATGAGFGVYLSGGNGCRVNFCSAEDMTGCGFWFEDQSNGNFDYNRTKNTGKDGVTNNHGILYNTTLATEGAVGMENVSISHCRVENSYRKGISGGSAGGRIKGLTVVGNFVSNAGLGGIYAGGTGGLTDPYYHVDCIFDDNVADGCGVGIEVYNVLGGSISGNVVKDTTSTFFGIFSAIKNCRMVGNYGSGSYTGGWQFNASIAANSEIDFIETGVFDVNTSGAPDAPRLGIVSVTNSRIGRLKGNAGGATYDFVEYSGSTNNHIFDLDNAGGGSAGSVLFLNAASTTTIEYADGRKLCGSITLAAGPNNDVALPMQYDNFVINGPTGAYEISGFSGVKEGRRVTITSNVGYVGTLLANSGLSSADNRLIPASGANLTLPILGSVDLTWMPGLQNGRWAVR